MAKLTISSKDKIFKEIDLKKTVSIGREKGDIILKNPTVSARHVKIEKVSRRFIVHDLDSTNGTFINGKKVSTQELRSGDVVSIGRFHLKFENPEEESSPVDSFGGDEDMGGMTIMVDSTQIKEGLKNAADAKKKVAAKPAKLFVHLSSGAPKVITLDKETTLIGSSSNSDVQIKGITIGNVAASITKDGKDYYVAYQGGFSKLKVDNKPVAKHKLATGNKFSISSYNFEFRTEL